MRPSASGILNGIGWLGILALVAAGLGVVRLLGFPGVLILGLLAALICTRAELSGTVPTWSRAVLAAREEDAEARAREVSALRYYRRCGLALALAGLAGTLWQVWS
ncbi:hypothetical protein [Roseomonas marmotae]|uniref:DUF2269 family protein n=1 Tax=Roseomonas marmotae TaxID=2768161 RepID=A0ABS3KGQ5_9PROT|nr:hypothetical protein [Roseomonas marmotae]MBO1076661.1 hypothetical protein [Roseomonas marmotae]QTI79602.1 hypothetical protein IAI58_01925 [Roseomonas marmotae]